MIVKELPIQYDHTEILRLYEKHKSKKDQTMINNRLGEFFSDVRDGIGGLNEYTHNNFEDVEFSWKYLNECFKGTYIEEVYNDILSKYIIGRSRFIEAKPLKIYSYHRDISARLHIPLQTNDGCFFIDDEHNMIPMHKLGTLYYTDTRKNHSACNMSRTETRIHMVFAVTTSSSSS